MTLKRAIISKKNIKTIAFVQSLLEKKSLHNYLLSIENKDTLLIDVLFKPKTSSSSSSSAAASSSSSSAAASSSSSSAAASSSSSPDNIEGEGILIWGESIDNRLVLCQLVNPYSRDKLPKTKKKKAQLTDGANRWLLQNQITVESYLSGKTSDPLIFDILTNPTSNTFSITQGEFSISNYEESKNSYIVWSNNSVFGLEDLDDDDNITGQVSYLPFFQSYSRYLKHGAYKQHGVLAYQISYCNEEKESSITPITIEEKKEEEVIEEVIEQVIEDIRDTGMYCALCGKELDSNKSGYTYDVDHVWNLILNGVLDVLDSPSGYFNTHDACNRSFKSDKVFTPNVGLWNKIYNKAKNYSSQFEGKREDYVWPGSIYGMEGIEGAVKPFGGWRVFTIGYINEEFRTMDYKNAGISINEVDILESEGLNHSGIQKSKKWRDNGRKFNELDLQLKFLKRTLLIANKLDGDVQKSDRDIQNDLVSSFESEIILLQQGAQYMQILQAIQENNQQKIPTLIKKQLNNRPVNMDSDRWKKLVVIDFLKASKDISRMTKPRSVIVNHTATDDQPLSTGILTGVREWNTHDTWNVFKQNAKHLDSILENVDFDEVATNQLKDVRGVLNGLITDLRTPGARALPEKWEKRKKMLETLWRKVDKIIGDKTWKTFQAKNKSVFATTTDGSPLGRRATMTSSLTPGQFTPGETERLQGMPTPAVRRSLVRRPIVAQEKTAHMRTDVFSSSSPAAPAAPGQRLQAPSSLHLSKRKRHDREELDGLEQNRRAQEEAEAKLKKKKKSRTRGGTKRKRRKKRKTRRKKKRKRKNKTRRKKSKKRRKKTRRRKK
jgi:hypothetical protein